MDVLETCNIPSDIHTGLLPVIPATHHTLHSSDDFPEWTAGLSRSVLLQDLDVLPDFHHFRKLLRLTKLELGGPALLIPRTISASGAHLLHVSTLHLEHYGFQTVPPSLFALPALHTLSLRHGPLNSLPAALPPNSIRFLSLDCNEFTEVPRALGSMSCLQTLQMSSNPLNFCDSLDFLVKLPRISCIKFGYELITSEHRGLVGLRSISTIAGFNLGTLWMALKNKAPKCSLYI